MASSTSKLIVIDNSASLEKWEDFPETSIETGSRGQCGQVLFEDSSSGLTVGLWSAEPNTTHWLDYPVDEYMVFIGGSACIRTDDAQATAELPTFGEGAKRSWFLPRLLRCKWVQPVPVRKVFIAVDEPKATTEYPESHGAHMKDAVAVDLAGSIAVPTSEDVNFKYFVQGRNATGQIIVGLASCSSATSASRTWSRHELLHVEKGEVAATLSSGETVQIAAGTTFFVPSGVELTLKSAKESDALLSFCAIQLRTAPSKL